MGQSLSRIRFVFFALAVCGLASPITPQAEEGSAIIKTANKDYRLDVGDVLSVVVLPADEVSRPEVVILPTGKLELMYIGAIQAKGYTLEQFRQTVTEALTKYVVNPKVTVALKRYGFRKVFLSGAIARAGEYEYKDGLRLLGLITLAGGLADKANARAVIIIRSRGDTSQTMAVDAEELKKEGRDFPLEAGDAIEIPKLLGEFLVFGEVKTPGSYAYEREIKLSGLIFKAGGFTDSAIRDRIRVIRGTKDNAKEYDLSRLFDGDFSQDIVMEKGDIVVVGKRGPGLWDVLISTVLPIANLTITLITLFTIINR